MTADMDIPSRPPPESSPKQHRRHGARVSKAHDEDEDDDEGQDDDGKSVVSAISEVSLRTRNTRKLIRSTTFSPQADNPYADLPIRSPRTTQTPRSSTSPAHREVDTTDYQSERLRSPPSGASRRYDQAPRPEYSRSPDGSFFRPESAERPTPSRPTRSRGFRDDTQSRGYGQSPTSLGQYVTADITRIGKPILRMPNVEDFNAPSSKNTPQYRESSPIQRRNALPSGYHRPSNPNSAADYASTRVESPSLKPGKPPRTSRRPYPEREGENYRRGERVSAASTPKLVTRQSYQATSPRDGAPSPSYPCPPSPASQKYGLSPTGQRPDPYLATVANATQENAYNRNGGITSPRNIPMPPGPIRPPVSLKGIRMAILQIRPIPSGYPLVLLVRDQSEHMKTISKNEEALISRRTARMISMITLPREVQFHKNQHHFYPNDGPRLITLIQTTKPS